jgi:hypothetical protein
MSVAVIVPYGGSDPYRLRNLQTVLSFYVARPVVVATNEGPFHKARAVNEAVAGLPPDIKTLVLNDADSLCYRSAIASATAAAESGPGLVFAFTEYRKLGDEQTARCETWRSALYANEWGGGQPTSESHGCVVMSRATFNEVGGYDERFTGWGYEDLAFNIACEARWPSRRTGWPLVHLWHPPAEENPANGELYARYEAARGDLAALNALREETLTC